VTEQNTKCMHTDNSCNTIFTYSVTCLQTVYFSGYFILLWI